jgi:hypothetical protein
MKTLSQIANEIETFLYVDLNEDGLNALLGLHCIDSTEEFHNGESGVSIVKKFLSNSGNWKGQHARRIKQELYKMIS